MPAIKGDMYINTHCNYSQPTLIKLDNENIGGHLTPLHLLVKFTLCWQVICYYVACPRISSPIFLFDGTLVSDKPQKLQRWRDYYSELLNKQKAPLSVELQDTVACAIPDDTIDCTPPTCREVHRAIYRLKDGKAPGLCNRRVSRAAKPASRPQLC